MRVNDLFRANLLDPTFDMNVHGMITFVGGIVSVVKEDPIAQMEVLQAVMKYDSFDENNNPHGEHDYGAFKVRDMSCMWKFDYYDLDYRYGSPDATDLAQTRRVLTIFLAEDY